MIALTGCTKETGSVKPEQSLAPESSQDIEFRDIERTCRCFMSIQRVENIPNNFSWALIDATEPRSGRTFEIEGRGSMWGYTPSTTNQPFPTPYIELKSPSDGEHMFYLVGYASNQNFVPANMTVHAHVNCYLYLNGSETGQLQTGTAHRFVWNQGTGSVYCDGLLCYRSFFRTFRCDRRTHDNDPVGY